MHVIECSATLYVTFYNEGMFQVDGEGSVGVCSMSWSSISSKGCRKWRYKVDLFLPLSMGSVLLNGNLQIV